MKVRLYVDIEEEVKRKIKAAAALRGESLNNYVEKLLEDNCEIKEETEKDFEG